MIRPMRQTRKRARSRSRSSHPDEGGSQRRRVRRKRTTCFDEGAEALRRPVFLVFIVNARQRSYLDSHPKPPGHGAAWHGSADNACWQFARRGCGLLLWWRQFGRTRIRHSCMHLFTLAQSSNTLVVIVKMLGFMPDDLAQSRLVAAQEIVRHLRAPVPPIDSCGDLPLCEDNQQQIDVRSMWLNVMKDPIEHAIWTPWPKQSDNASLRG